MGHRTATAKGRYVNAHRRDRDVTPEKMETLRRAVQEAMVEDYLERLIDAPPGLTAQQRARLADMLQGMS